MASSDLFVTSFTLQTNTIGVPLWETLKRYTKASPSLQKTPSQSGCVLIFAHGVGFHKEQWEPTINHLFKLDTQNTIREAWTNVVGYCVSPFTSILVLLLITAEAIYDYTEALVILRRDLLGDSNPEYSRKNRFILIGHSAGTVACVMALVFSNPPSNVMFDSLVLVETPIHHPSAEAHHTAMFKAFAVVNNCHDIWPSREAARAWLAPLIVFQNHGLRPLPTAFYFDKTDGIILSVTWVDENAAYSKDAKTSFTALWNLNTICGVVPIHLVCGARTILCHAKFRIQLLMPVKEGLLLL
ncbi:uncharacterized protein EV420DRAFT_1682223 [Desarmillaria tabescens]|uniref:AB hydrolase-1 domain-containing protein n=1 Tax=Armillaria tabescens TaxID=1929756 RepID=A0AA39KC09_ARMTA|nr:uncharacterized protein EV420DRAFT_1682223 [Desarmillaria tabescens]KAK0458202.1 hypothetical protein EV420DRAFT_1682223 [Desarmillaria tabescens]